MVMEEVYLHIDVFPSGEFTTAFTWSTDYKGALEMAKIDSDVDADRFYVIPVSSIKGNDLLRPYNPNTQL